MLSGNRNFERRVIPLVKANYLAYDIAGAVRVNLYEDPLGEDRDGDPSYLKDIWLSQEQVGKIVEMSVTRETFMSKYTDVFGGGEAWRGVETAVRTDVLEASALLRGDVTGAG